MIPPETIRDIHASDEAVLAAFFLENNRPAITDTFHPFPLEAATAHRLCQDKRLDHYFGYFREAAIIGLGMLRGWDEGYVIPSFGVIVDHRQQGRGIGSKLTEFAVNRSRELGCSKVRLTVYPANVRAVKIYESRGFKAVETQADGRLVMIAEL